MSTKMLVFFYHMEDEILEEILDLRQEIGEGYPCKIVKIDKMFPKASENFPMYG